jgi:hypothetical protein
MTSCFLTRVPKLPNNERTVFSKNDAKETGYSHSKEIGRTLTSYHTQKMKNESRT